jgi:exosortase A
LSGEITETMAAHRRSGVIMAAWTPAALCLAVIAVATIPLYWVEVSGAVRVWYGSAAYNHGFLILPIVLYLIWERRQIMQGLAPQPLFRVLPLVVVVGLAWLVARLIGLLEAEQLLLIAMLQLVILSIVGWRAYRALAFPLLYLFSLVPTGDFLVPALQEFTARFTVFALRLSGVPVFSDGFLITIPNASFYVAEACAGLRFLIATIAFGFLFAEFAYDSIIRRVSFILVCMVAPIIANGLRAYGIILLAYLTDGELAAGVDHVVYGWLFFSIVTIGLMAGGWFFRNSHTARLVAPIEPLRQSSALKVLLASVLALCLVALPAAYAAFLERDANATTKERLAVPSAAAPWVAAAQRGEWQPVFQHADVAIKQSFQNGTDAADLYLAYYRTQNANKKLVSFENKLVEGKGWEISDRSTATIEIAGETVPVAVTRFVSSGRKRVVFSSYWVDGHFEANGIMAKFLQAKAALTGGPRDAALVAFSTIASDDWAAADARLKDLAAHLGSVETALRTVADR